jgi:precorrin-3B synthase
MTQRGWCPSLAAPMPAVDGLLVRVRPRLQRLTAAEARLIAAAARRFGNGMIEVTSRGNVQLRGFSAASAAECAAMIGHLDAAALRPGLVVAPLLGVDPAGHPDAAELADAIAALLAGGAALSGRAEKFFVALDDGSAAGLGDVGADIAIRADGGAWVLRRDGEAAAVRVATADVLGVVRGWLAVWLDSGVARMRALFPSGEGGRGADDAAVVAGYLASALAFGVGVQFGAMDADGLMQLVDQAVRFGDGAMRLGPGRVVWLTGVSPESAGKIAPGLVGVSACVGRAGCAAASTDTRADAVTMAAWGVGHVSGCAKGCAHPGPAAVTLVGVDGLYDVVRHGRAGDAPVRTGLTLAGVAAYLAGISA